MPQPESAKNDCQNGCSTRPGRTPLNLARLGGYVATTVGTGILATPSAEAAVIPINIGPSGFDIGGVNAGITGSDYVKIINGFPAPGGGILGIVSHPNLPSGQSILASSTYFFGLCPVSASGLQIAGGGSITSPTNLSQGATIDASLSFNADTYSLFRYNTLISPDFGAGSYIGFRNDAGGGSSIYGYLEVTWTSATSTFEILSGAYESPLDTPILAGAPPSPVPEVDPSGCAGVASMAIGSIAMLERRRRRRAATGTAATD